MNDTLRDLILDFREAELATGVPRRIDVTPVPGKATVCIGPRRAGKSTFLFQLVQRLLDRGVPRDNILYLNFFDDRLRHLQRDGLGVVADAYFSLHPEKKNAETVYCFFDEIQVVPGWEPFVDRLMRTESCEVYITGSSARMLSREIATQMRGRALSWEIFPFSFREFLDFRGIDGAGPLSTRRRLLVRKAFDDYWARGGFPEVAGLDRRLRVKVHQEYWGAMLFRDLVERHDVSHPRAVADLAHWLVDDVVWSRPTCTTRRCRCGRRDGRLGSTRYHPSESSRVRSHRPAAAARNPVRGGRSTRWSALNGAAHSIFVRGFRRAGYAGGTRSCRPRTCGHRVALFRQPAHRLSAIARTPSAEVGRVRLPRMVRGRLIPVHGAHIRRVPGAREHESQEGLLRRPRPGPVGRLGHRKLANLTPAKPDTGPAF